MTAIEKNVVRKHTSAIHISNEISALERKISNVLLKHAFKDILFAEQHQVSLQELLLDIGWDNTNKVSQHFIESIKRLNTTQVEWNILGKDKKRKWGVTTLLAGLEIEDGIVFYSYSKELRQWLGSPNIYAVLDLDHQKKLKSKYSLALWEYAVEQLDSSREEDECTVTLALPKLQALLGILDENNALIEYKHLNQMVLKKAVGEINAKTDIIITSGSVRLGRRVSNIVFNIKRAPHIKQLEIFDTSVGQEVDALGLIKGNIEIEDAVGKGRKLKLTDAQIQKYIAEFGASKVAQVLNLVLKKIKDGVLIENIGGYIHSLIHKEVAVPVSTHALYPHLLQEQEIKKHLLEDETAHFINHAVISVKDPHLQAILKACRAAIPTQIMKVGLEQGAFVIQSMENQDKQNIKILLKHSARYSGYQDMFMRAAEQELKALGYQYVEVKIAQRDPLEIAKIAREMLES